MVEHPSDDRLDPFDYFGSTLATGDFNGNGYPDLAVGHPNEGSLKGIYSGAVTVIFSTDQGLINFKRQELTQASGIDKEERYDQFGSYLAAADFNGDGIDELQTP